MSLGGLWLPFRIFGNSGFFSVMDLIYQILFQVPVEILAHIFSRCHSSTRQHHFYVN